MLSSSLFHKRHTLLRLKERHIRTLPHASHDTLQSQAQLKELAKEARIIGSHEAQGPAKQILPDSHFINESPLRQTVADCAQTARSRSAKRKVNSLTGLITHSGAHVRFSSASREAISPTVLQMIRCGYRSAICHAHHLRSCIAELLCIANSAHCCCRRSVGLHNQSIHFRAC